jgi:hypothetical protein
MLRGKKVLIGLRSNGFGKEAELQMNSSLDFLNMIKNGDTTSRKVPVRETATNVRSVQQTASTSPVRESSQGKDIKASSKKAEMKSVHGGTIAVIDTETNWRDEVMSIGIALADEKSFELKDKRYYIFEPEVMIGGYFSSVVHMRGLPEIVCSRREAMEGVKEYLHSNNVTRILAYNAKFDLGHLPELAGFEWFDIMRLAAYKQYNSAIPDSLPCCKSGRLKTGYGVEPIMRLLTGESGYCEVHNAVIDAVDELRIARLLGHGMEVYECARL